MVELAGALLVDLMLSFDRQGPIGRILDRQNDTNDAAARHKRISRNRKKGNEKRSEYV